MGEKRKKKKESEASQEASMAISRIRQRVR